VAWLVCGVIRVDDIPKIKILVCSSHGSLFLCIAFSHIFLIVSPFFPFFILLSWCVSSLCVSFFSGVFCLSGACCQFGSNHGFKLD
jgi:hypothetical protein